MDRIRGLLFDKDGTLFDFHATWGAWTGKFIRDVSRNPDEAARLAHVLGFDDASGRFQRDSVVIAGTPQQVMAAIEHALPWANGAEMLDLILDSSAEAPLVEAAPLRPLLTQLRDAGLVLGVSTNDSEKVATAHLEKVGVADLLDPILGYDSGYGGKPEPGMQRAFLHETRLEPHQVAMVGDSLHDMEAGRRAGMIRVAVLTGHADRDTLTPHADIVLPDIGHLPAWLGIA